MRDHVGQLQLIEKPLKKHAFERAEAKDTDWRVLHDKVKSRDSAMLKDYHNELDTLLVFAGLFSAILTAFIVDVYQDLKVNSDDVTANTLRLILNELQGHRVTLPDLTARPSPTVVAVVSLWFVSLVLSLLSALFCIFMKQWLHVYNKWTDQDSFHQGLVLRAFYQTNLRTWHISDIFATLGVLLQVALVLFVIGLVAYLWTLTNIVSSIVTCLVLVMIVLSGITIVLPVFYVDCPYKFPLAYLLLLFRTRGTHRDWAERDLPTAERRFMNPNSPLDIAIAEAALLLDIYPEVLRNALAEPAGHASTLRGAGTVREKIRQLSPAASRLLTVALTGDALIEDHSRPSDNAHRGSDDAALYRLWKLVFSNMGVLPCIMFALLRHTPDDIEPAGSLQEDQYFRLVVELYRHCGAACLSGELISGIAQVVDDWVERVRDTMPRTLTVYSSLRALYHAMDHAFKGSRKSLPAAGLSPVTAYRPLLASMDDRVTKARELLRELPQSSQYAPYSRALGRLIGECTSLHADIVAWHALFLCLACREYRVSGMTHEARTVTFSEDSTELFVGTDEAAAWIIELGSGTARSAVPSLPSDSDISHAAFTRDRKWIIWGSRAGPVVLLDRAAGTYRLLSDLAQGMHSCALAISHDQARVLIGSEISTAVLLDAASREVIMSFEGHTKRFIQAAFAPAPHNLLATSSADNTVKVWDVESGICRATYAGLGRAVNGVAWSPDGGFLAISCMLTIRVFNSATGDLFANLDGHSNLVTNLSFAPSGIQLASSSYDRTVRVWSLDQQYCIAVLTGPLSHIYAVEFSPDGSYLACAACDGVWIWDINPDSEFTVAPIHVIPADVGPACVAPADAAPMRGRLDRWRQAAKRAAKLSVGIRNFMNV